MGYREFGALSDLVVQGRRVEARNVYGSEIWEPDVLSLGTTGTLHSRAGLSTVVGQPGKPLWELRADGTAIFETLTIGRSGAYVESGLTGFDTQVRWFDTDYLILYYGTTTSTRYAQFQAFNNGGTGVGDSLLIYSPGTLQLQGVDDTKILGGGGTLRLSIGDTITRVGNAGIKVNAVVDSNEFHADDGASASDPSYTFADDTDTGMYRPGGGQLGFSVNGTLVVDMIGQGIALPNHNTTGSAANAHIANTGTPVGIIRRSTSSLRYKPDWEFVNEEVLADLEMPVPIVWSEDLDGETQHYLGFGTEHVAQALPEHAVQDDRGYGPEVYDVRSLVAVLSAKVKRLERKVAALEEAASL